MTIKVNLSNLNSLDRVGSAFRVKFENARLAAQNPPGIAMPFGTNQETQDSYEKILESRIAAEHESFIAHAADFGGPTFKDFREALRDATPEKRQAAIDAGFAALA